MIAKVRRRRISWMGLMWSLSWRRAPPRACPAGARPGARSAGRGGGYMARSAPEVEGPAPYAALNAGANASAAHASIDVGVDVAAERGCVVLRCPSLNPFDIST